MADPLRPQNPIHDQGTSAHHARQTTNLARSQTTTSPQAHGGAADSLLELITAAELKKAQQSRQRKEAKLSKARLSRPRRGTAGGGDANKPMEWKFGNDSKPSTSNNAGTNTKAEFSFVNLARVDHTSHQMMDYQSGMDYHSGSVDTVSMMSLGSLVSGGDWRGDQGSITESFRSQNSSFV